VGAPDPGRAGEGSSLPGLNYMIMIYHFLVGTLSRYLLILGVQVLCGSGLLGALVHSLKSIPIVHLQLWQSDSFLVLVLTVPVSVSH
jgi:hypothetical protein